MQTNQNHKNTHTFPKVVIYTDGACDPNPGPGGWAAIIRIGVQKKILTGNESHTTNNRMELKAAIEALNYLKEPNKVNLYTDSEYLKRGVNEWMPNWKLRNWRRKSGKLANVDLWMQLDDAIKYHQVVWHWIRGHTGNPDNEHVDKLAKKEILKTKK